MDEDVFDKSIDSESKESEAETTDLIKTSEEDNVCYTLDRKPNVNIREIDEIDIDEIIRGYKAGMSVKELADLNEIGWQKITKILVTANIYTSETYDKIKELREAGKVIGRSWICWI